MSRTQRDRKRITPPPVQNIEVNDKQWKLRIAALIIFAVIAVGSLLYYFVGKLSMERGWQEIDLGSISLESCASDFTLYYNLGAGEVGATAEYKALAALYSSSAEKAYRWFHSEEIFEGVHNVATLNQNPNQVFTVDEVLYQAFELLQTHGNRYIYLAPIYEQYQNLYYSQEDYFAQQFDPYANEELAADYAQICRFINDPASIDLELLGGGKVRLKVSQEYLAYAQENAIEAFLDFNWMKNAFILDYLADSLLHAGYSYGSISSYDGFSRLLTDADPLYHTSILGGYQNQPILAGTLEHTGPMTTVGFHDYPFAEGMQYRTYVYANGTCRTGYIDPTDGLCRSAVSDLTVYSQTASCAELLLQAAPVFIAEELDETALSNLNDSIYIKDQTIYCNDPGAKITNLYESSTLTFVLAK